MQIRRTKNNYWKFDVISLEVNGRLVGVHRASVEIRDQPVTIPLEYPSKGNII